MHPAVILADNTVTQKEQVILEVRKVSSITYEDDEYDPEVLVELDNGIKLLYEPIPLM
jgi:hypothetical protein